MNVGIINLAVEEANKAEHFDFKIGAVIFKSNRIISSGRNQFRSCTIPIKYRKRENTLHAEQDAVNGVEWKKLSSASILVVRLNKSGKFSLSFPCEYCLSTLKYVKVKWIYYTNRVGEIRRYRV